MFSADQILVPGQVDGCHLNEVVSHFGNGHINQDDFSTLAM